MPGIATDEVPLSSVGLTISDAANFLRDCSTAQTALLHITSTSSLAGIWEGTYDLIGQKDTSGVLITEATVDWFVLPSLIVQATGGVIQNDPGDTITPADDVVIAAATMGSRFCRFRRTAGSGTASASVCNDTLAQITESAVTVVTAGGGSAKDASIVRDDAAWVPAAATSFVGMQGFLADETATDSVTEGDAGAARITLDRRQITAGNVLDDAAFGIGTQYVNPAGFLADETAADSVDEGDAGLARMTLDRRQIMASQVLDDAAFGIGTEYVTAIGALADETTPDSVTEGDIGALRMTLDRLLKATAEMESGFLRSAGTQSTVKYAIIDAATSGDNTLVAAVASKKIRVLNVVLIASGAVNVRFESGASGTALSGQMNLTTNSGFAPGEAIHGHFETAVNTLLNLELSGAVSVDGWLTYIEVL